MASPLRYSGASAETRVVFSRYDPHFSAGSLDEAYLDVTDVCRERGMTPAQVTRGRVDGWWVGD
jgi:DNA polymerase kappa